MGSLGSLGDVSYRTLVAETADAQQTQGTDELEVLSSRWSARFWGEYTRVFATSLARVRELSTHADIGPTEQDELAWWTQTLSGGFCIGGRWGGSRRSEAYEVTFNPLMQDVPKATPIQPGRTRFWGCPNLIERLLWGIDWGLLDAIQKGGKWTGSQDELFELLAQYMLGQPADLPLREAIDWVYVSIYTTIKAMKFSHLAPVCGGPIEIAVITTDRRFRWVRHKAMGEAIT